MAISRFLPGLVALLYAAGASGAALQRRGCLFDWPAAEGETCEMMATDWGIALDDFISYNPGVQCPSLNHGVWYCVQWEGELPPPQPPATAITTTTQQPTTTQQVTTTTTTGGNGIETPQPIQQGMVSNCNKFYFVQPGDSCANIATAHGITQQQFQRWNSGLGATCGGLWASTYACVSIIGFTPPTTTTAPPTTTTTPPGNGISTPEPIQPGMVSNCNKFYLVKLGDSCANIATAHGITQQQFQTWNTGLGSACGGLWANTYACVGIIGFTPPTTTTRPPTTTTAPPGNGISTPAPIQPGMVSNCNKFYLVRSGDSCADIATVHRITQQQFQTWNSGVGSTCSGLWADTYACVGIIGFTPPPPTTTTRPTTTTTTRSGNGISTPTPTQPGMVSNCDRFYLVKSGDTCASIGARHGVTAARITQWNTGVGSSCSGLWANSYVCVRTIGYQSRTSLTCSTASNRKPWSSNKPAALAAVVNWCDGNSRTDGSGGFSTGQAKTGCYQGPSGTNRLQFTARNDFGIGTSLSVAKCNELITAAINHCNHGSSGTHEGWWFRAVMTTGTC